MSSRPSVLVSVPNTGWIHKQVIFVLMRLQTDSRYRLRIILPTHNPFENNLHHIIKEWIEESREDFWLTIDSDNPPMENPLDLVELDKDIIGCPTPVWHCKNPDDPIEQPFYWNAYDYVMAEDAYRPHEPQDGLQRVDAVGTGCVLFARRVFDNPEMRKAPFQRQYYEDGRVYKGNDISFCERARVNGFSVFCHYEYPCLHFNEIEINEVVGAFRSLYE